MQTIAGGSTNSISFQELIERSSALSRQLAKSGLKSQGRVALLMENDHDFGIGLLAAASAGAVIVPLDPSYDVSRLCEVIAHAQCEILIWGGAYSEQAREIGDQLPNLVQVSPITCAEGAQTIPWPLVRRDPDDDFLLIYTGGTTGAPKGVRLSLHSVMTVIAETLEVFPLSARDHVLSILPLFHIMAIQANLLGPLYAGARISYLQTREPQAILDAFREHGITAFVCVPLFYQQVHRRIFGEIARQRPAKRMLVRALLRTSRFVRKAAGWNAGRLLFRPVHQRFGAQLRGFGVGAARFAPELASDFHDLGFRFFQGYGMTETCGLAAITPMSLEGGLTSGRPLRNIEIRIDTPDGEGHGEILLRGAGIMKGYWQDQEATTAALENGWLRTGDLGYLAKGDLHVVGRKKEVIVLSSGKNIFPEPLETWFQSNCPLIQEICVFSVRENKAGERLHALLVPDSAKLREQGVVNVREELRYRIDNLNRQRPPHERLKGFDIRLEPLPRTSSRKLQRFRIQEEFDRTRVCPSGHEELPSDDANEPAASAAIRDLIAHIRPGRRIHAAMNLELDLSFDSLERVELLANVQEAFGIQITPEQAAGLLTVGDFIALAPDHAEPRNGWAEWRDILQQPLSDKERDLADRYLGARPLATPFFFFATKIFSHVARILFRYHRDFAWKWDGADPAILCANHQSYLDFPLIAGALPYGAFRRIFTLSTSRLAKSRLQEWFGRTVRAVPVDPDRNPRTALRLAREGLRRGMVLCVFPEGHRSMDGRLQPFRKGAAIVAVESAAVTVPIGITGTGTVWGRASKRIRLAPVSLKIGAALRPSADEEYESFNRRLRQAVEELLN